jgi:methyl-accepting chemotaxis protein
MPSIKHKLVLFFSLLIAGVVATALFTNSIHHRTKEINRNWLPSIIHVSTMNMLTSDYRIRELQHILSTSQEDMARYEKEMADVAARIRNEMSQYELLITTESERRLHGEFLSKWNEYNEYSVRLMAVSRMNRNEEARALIRARSQQLFDEFSHHLSMLVEENRAAAQSETHAGERMYLLAVTSLVFLCGVMVGFVYQAGKHVRSMFDRIVHTCVRIMAERSN